MSLWLHSSLKLHWSLASSLFFTHLTSLNLTWHDLTWDQFISPLSLTLIILWPAFSFPPLPSLHLFPHLFAHHCSWVLAPIVFAPIVLESLAWSGTSSWPVADSVTLFLLLLCNCSDVLVSSSCIASRIKSPSSGDCSISWRKDASWKMKIRFQMKVISNEHLYKTKEIRGRVSQW